MRYAIIGDLHGSDLSDLEKALDDENPDVLICTGDFDQTRTIRQFKRLEIKYQVRGKEVIKVPGNHDHAILYNLPINSETLRRQGKNVFQLYQELLYDSDAYNFIESLVNSKIPGYTNNRVRIFLDEQKFGKEFQTIIIHGAYDGDLSSYPDCPEEIRDLWTRLRTTEDYRKNFDVMAKKDYKVMIRGHDHEPLYVYLDQEKGIVSYKPEGDQVKYRLFPRRRHVINPGAVFDRRFAVIDTNVPGEKVPILIYRKI